MKGYEYQLFVQVMFGFVALTHHDDPTALDENLLNGYSMIRIFQTGKLIFVLFCNKLIW